MTPRMTLFGIETTLFDLLAEREQANNMNRAAPTDEWVTDVDARIETYIKAELRKVDGIAKMLKEFEARALAAKEEAQRISRIADLWEARRERLKAITTETMIATGKTELHGAVETLSLRKCPPSVEIAQPELVPGEYLRVELSMTMDIFRLIESALAQGWKDSFPTRATPADGSVLAEFRASSNPARPPREMKREIATALKGGGGVPGCRLVEDKLTLVVK